MVKGRGDEEPVNGDRLRAFGAALRAARERHQPRITQEALAETMKVSQALVSGWEAGQKEPGRDAVFAVEKALDLAPGILSRKLGYLPVEWDSKRKKMTFEEFIEIDVDKLTEAERNVLIDLYRQFTGKK